MGRELAADRNIPVRMVAPCSPAQSLPTAGGSASGLKPYKTAAKGEFRQESDVGARAKFDTSLIGLFGERSLPASMAYLLVRLQCARHHAWEAAPYVCQLIGGGERWIPVPLPPPKQATHSTFSIHDAAPTGVVRNKAVRRTCGA